MEIKNRKNIEIKQGSDQWIEHRKKWVGGASEAPAMMSKSKHFTRTQLIEDRIGIKKEFSDFMMKIMEKGHVDEENARNILEIELMEDYPAEVWQAEINGMLLGASLDGGCKPLKQAFEHKSKNKDLIHNMKRNLLDPHYTLQLDQIILVSPYNSVRFICSDGTDVNKEELIYTSTPKKLEDLVAGWEQFIIDRDNFVFETKIEKVEPTKTTQFPAITYKIDGSSIRGNFDQYKPAIEEISKHVFKLISREDKTDLDFGNLDHYAKAGEKERKALKSNLEEVKRVFESYAKFESNIKDCDSIIQKFSAAANKSSKEAKEEIKNLFVASQIQKIDALDDELNSKLNFRICLEPTTASSKNLHSAGKGKRTIESFKEAVRSEVVRIKIEMKQKFELVKIFDSYLSDKKEYDFLFKDKKYLVENNLNDFEQFKSIVNQRIEEHKKREAEKIEQAKRNEEERLKREAEKIEQAKRNEEERLKREAEKIEQAKRNEEERLKREAEKIEQAKRNEEERLKREAEELESVRKSASATIKEHKFTSSGVNDFKDRQEPFEDYDENKELEDYKEDSVFSIMKSTGIKRNIVTLHSDSLEICIEGRKYSCDIYSGLETYKIIHRLQYFIKNLSFKES